MGADKGRALRAIEVSFRGMAPRDALVYFIRRCAAARHLRGEALKAHCEALLRIDKFSDTAKQRVRQLLQPLIDEMTNASGGRCLGQIAEVYDGDPPHRPSGCPAQAWSVAEVLRLLTLVS